MKKALFILYCMFLLLFLFVNGSYAGGEDKFIGKWSLTQAVKVWGCAMTETITIQKLGGRFSIEYGGNTYNNLNGCFKSGDKNLYTYKDGCMVLSVGPFPEYAVACLEGDTLTFMVGSDEFKYKKSLKSSSEERKKTERNPSEVVLKNFDPFTFGLKLGVSTPDDLKQNIGRGLPPDTQITEHGINQTFKGPILQVYGKGLLDNKIISPVFYFNAMNNFIALEMDLQSETFERVYKTIERGISAVKKPDYSKTPVTAAFQKDGAVLYMETWNKDGENLKIRIYRNEYLPPDLAAIIKRKNKK